MPVSLPEHVAKVVRIELASRKMRQTQLRRVTGMGRAALSRRILGEVPFTVAELSDVAKALGMTPGELVDRADLATQVEQPVTPRQHTVSPALPPQRSRQQKAAGPTSGPAPRVSA